MTPLLPALTPTHSGSTPAVNRVYHCDWRALVGAMPDQSVSAYILDLPYGTTACSWDEIIPFEPMWREVKRTLKPRGVFVTTASQPFTSKLVMSNLAWFKYSWVWKKSRPTGYIHAKNMPLKLHEDVVVFSVGVINHEQQTQSRMNYYPIKSGKVYSYKVSTTKNRSIVGYRPSHEKMYGKVVEIEGGYPTSVLEFDSASDFLHPTQKPVALYEYLIATYTQPGDLVVDFCCGSGTTAVAARNLKRDYIVRDSDAHYCNIARERLRMPYERHYITPDNDVSSLPLFAGA